MTRKQKYGSISLRLRNTPTKRDGVALASLDKVVFQSQAQSEHCNRLKASSLVSASPRQESTQLDHFDHIEHHANELMSNSST
jgi:hypothetical protein